MLKNAGVAHARDPATIDERAIRDELLKSGATAETAALALARAKAAETATRHPGALVIGADQILECGARWFEKANGADDARRTLRALQGRAHRLVSAVSVQRDAARAWEHVETADLTMRRLGDDEIERYLAEAGPEALESVGVYRLEGIGARLFTRVEGDFFTILGLPLLPLLAFLREAGALDG